MVAGSATRITCGVASCVVVGIGRACPSHLAEGLASTLQTADPAPIRGISSTDFQKLALRQLGNSTGFRPASPCCPTPGPVRPSTDGVEPIPTPRRAIRIPRSVAGSDSIPPTRDCTAWPTSHRPPDRPSAVEVVLGPRNAGPGGHSRSDGGSYFAAECSPKTSSSASSGGVPATILALILTALTALVAPVWSTMAMIRSSTAR